MHFLSSKDLSKNEMNKVFAIADSFKDGVYAFLDSGTTLALLFQKPSTRTRLSFEAAMIQLGGIPIYIDSSTTQLSRGETLGDTARVMSSYVDMIACRFYRQEELEEFAASSSVPVINALTDLEHPCQALSDIYTIREAKGRINGVRIAFVGDIAENTANSLMLTAAKLGAKVALVGPKGCKPNSTYLSTARKEGKIEVYSDIEEGVRGADVIYTDTFVSMGQEEEAKERLRLFKRYQVNARLVGLAKKDAVVMHCLPAHRNVEITSEVLDGKQSIVWQQARNKMLIEKALILYLHKRRREESEA